MEEGDVRELSEEGDIPKREEMRCVALLRFNHSGRRINKGRRCSRKANFGGYCTQHYIPPTKRDEQ